MKFCYEYRTRENELRKGVLFAGSRDAAYAKLKRDGIKPSRVEIAPGCLNRALDWASRHPLAVLVAVLAVVLLGGFFALRAISMGSTSFLQDSILSPLRRQVIGDQGVIEQGIRTGWSSVFKEDGEQFLASFAIPGVMAGKRSTSEKAVSEALERKIEISDRDSIEVRQIKSMVEGMKEELRRFLAAGGSIRRYGERLVARQEAEIGYYTRVKNEIGVAVESRMPNDELIALLDSRNAELRRMGIKLVTLAD